MTTGRIVFWGAAILATLFVFGRRVAISTAAPTTTWPQQSTATFSILQPYEAEYASLQRAGLAPLGVSPQVPIPTLSDWQRAAMAPLGVNIW